MTAKQTLDRVRDSGVVAIVRTTSTDDARAQVATLLDAGLRVVEVSLTTPGAIEVIAEYADTPDAVIGAGTVLDTTAAQNVIDAGAQIIVSPDFNEDVVRLAADRDIASLPGCLTPTEMMRATRAGATAVKIFPAHIWTPGALSGMLQALPDLRCVPTGGVSPGSAPDWIGAGAVAVGVGAALTRVDDPAAQARALLASIAQARGDQ
ncbi:bifunctional 4-hydroxy-2-oxoglutarate aldolase/2-dehydro-3-deoxy-phosphogluconate aldolase [Epidermidibacterium keratini]|uniref:Bifunctional 4-hydroxy-2-oxoglutarate aldolase/2-dehydro-3-deoxy-phosphogluconate aldolase n=1 Tax=Epidermidibacterium keratini TaxID=1891644 RepID=A0A7L4YNA9_9ACTN|nr:bifunctional 4-hydroxy-2-oxoglutarate aldolase/2-dehydro-3-deoxy-phosphogluconate aldolase [Epidermidibacterium keratini]QHC00626.1 bifunctional 4-hydroxy-2-oxoglutarate aldolase/2-dehydro-3-deoxy-phosphogluconate aldolase [Epidermidibacterium keratini]